MTLEQKYAVAYIRVSTGEQTTDNQRLAITAWAERQGYCVLDFFEDAAVSGKIDPLLRTGFSKMAKFVETDAPDAILIYELSRLGRDMYTSIETIKHIERYVPIIPISPRESFLQTTEPSIRKLLIGILTWVAEREREMLVQRTKDGMIRAKAAGKSIGRPRKELPLEQVTILTLKGVSKNRMAKELGVSKATLYKHLNKWNLVKVKG